MDDGWTPWPPRPRWTAYELTAEWDSAEEPLAYLASLSEREWALVQAAAGDAPDADGVRPARFVVAVAGEMVAALAGHTALGGRPS